MVLRTNRDSFFPTIFPGAARLLRSSLQRRAHISGPAYRLIARANSRNYDSGICLREVIEETKWRSLWEYTDKERDNLYALYSGAMRQLRAYGLVKYVYLRATLKGENDHHLHGYMLRYAEPTREGIVEAVNNLWYLKSKGISYKVEDSETVEKLVGEYPNVKWETIPLARASLTFRRYTVDASIRTADAD